MRLASQYLQRSEDELAAIARLLVDPDHRRNGVARALLDIVIAEAGRLGRAPILDVATHYANAIGLYEATGWHCIGEVTMQLPNGEPFREFVYITTGTE
jgi:GNAT superfamily N-acetyltransferase